MSAVQNERVLALLRQRGEAGVTPIDFAAPAVDGGAPIMRLAARVHDLREEGVAIETGRDGKVARYVLGGQS